jgi:hypothetical protein
MTHHDGVLGVHRMYLVHVGFDVAHRVLVPSDADRWQP